MQLTGLEPLTRPLPWQTATWQNLQQQFEAGRLPHALLLTGAQHTGKNQLALALARYLLCHQPLPEGNCGECTACERSAGGVHGDFRWIQPEDNSRVLKVGQIRGLVEFVTQTAGYGPRQISVLSPASAMNNNAFNALLKSLEEPAQNTFIILVCHGIHNVPATVRSRCQLVRLPTPEAEVCLNWLEPLIPDRDAREIMLNLADGQPLLAKFLYESGDAEVTQAQRVTLRAVLAGKVPPTAAAGLWDDASMEQVLEQLSAELERVLPQLTTPQLQSRAGRDAFLLLDELGGLRRAVSNGANPNKQMLLDSILSKIQSRLGPVLSGDNIS